MTARWPDPNRATIDRYVASLDLRSMKSRTCYRQVLYGFQDVAERHEALDQEVLLAWLKGSANRRATSTLLHRTRIVDRFLERLVEISAIECNPVVALRDECNIKQCMPIWRALASRDPEQALAELRQPKPFGSVLGEMMAEHVVMMRRRGYKYTSQPLLLLRFDRFLQLHPGPLCKRALVETAMSRYKGIFGPRLRARSFPAQQTEAAIGVAVLNRMLACGRPKSVRCEASARAAK